MKLTIRNGVLLKCSLSPGEKHVTIPPEVTAIGKKAFDNNKTIETITLPEGLKEIGDYAFDGCSNLREVRIPSSVLSIGHRAFVFCKNLRSFYVPESVQVCGGYELEWCESLDTIHVYREDGVYAISVPRRQLTGMEEDFGHDKYHQSDHMLEVLLTKKFWRDYFENDGAFTYVLCDMLGSGLDRGDAENHILLRADEFFSQMIAEDNWEALLLLLESRKVLGMVSDDVIRRLLAYAVNYSQVYPLFRQIQRGAPTELLTIRDGVLVRCNDRCVKEVTIPEGVTVIGGGAFEECEVETVYVPDSLQRIGHGAFVNCISLCTLIPASMRDMPEQQNTIILPEGLQTIGRLAFGSCLCIGTLKLPSTLESIGECAFDYTYPTYIEIPDTAKYLGEKIFYRGVPGTIIIYKKDGSRYTFKDDYDYWRVSEILAILLRRNFKKINELGAETRLQLLTGMLVDHFDDGETAGYVMTHKDRYLYPLIGGNRMDLIETLLQKGDWTDPAFIGVMEAMVHSANEIQDYEVQMKLMEAMKDHLPDMQERLQL